MPLRVSAATIGEASVKAHLHHIYEKLRLRDRLQLSIYSREKRPTT